MGTGSWGEAVPLVPSAATALPASAEADREPDRRPGCAAEPAAEAAAEATAGRALGRVQPPPRPLLAGHEVPRSPVRFREGGRWKDPHVACVLMSSVPCGSFRQLEDDRGAGHPCPGHKFPFSAHFPPGAPSQRRIPRRPLRPHSRAPLA